MLNIDQLKTFIKKSGANTYAGGGKFEDHPERPGFRELVYQEDDWFYRDSYSGYTRSRGMEVVRYKDQPVWSCSYGGGMLAGKEERAEDTFAFLKKAMLTKDPSFASFRGPKSLIDGDWEYKYSQEGDVEEFMGYEEIWHKGEQVFFHCIIGGLIKN